MNVCTHTHTTDTKRMDTRANVRIFIKCYFRCPGFSLCTASWTTTSSISLVLVGDSFSLEKCLWADSSHANAEQGQQVQRLRQPGCTAKPSSLVESAVLAGLSTSTLLPRLDLRSSTIDWSPFSCSHRIPVSHLHERSVTTYAGKIQAKTDTHDSTHPNAQEGIHASCKLTRHGWESRMHSQMYKMWPDIPQLVTRLPRRILRILYHRYANWP